MTIRALVVALALILGPAVEAGAAPSPGPSPEVRRLMAPTGALRVALYKGTTTSVVSETDRRGVGYALGQELARQLGVPFAPMILESNAQVQATMQAKGADIAFVNPLPERAKDMDFTQPHLAIARGYLAGPQVKAVDLAEVDRPGVRVGVTVGSSLIDLTRDLKNAKVVAVPNLDAAIAMLNAGTLDFFATNKATLGAMTDKVPGSRVLDGSWGVEHLAMAMPKGREAALPYARAFIADVTARGMVRGAADRAGLKGRVEETSAP